MRVTVRLRVRVREGYSEDESKMRATVKLRDESKMRVTVKLRVRVR